MIRGADVELDKLRILMKVAETGSFTRAAEEMGLNLSTAKTRLRRGREKLKEHLRKAGFCVEEAEDLKPDERVSGSGE